MRCYYEVLVDPFTGETWVPPTREDGEMDPADCTYPTVADAVNDLVDARLESFVELVLTIKRKEAE